MCEFVYFLLIFLELSLCFMLIALSLSDVFVPGVGVRAFFLFLFSLLLILSILSAITISVVIFFIVVSVIILFFVLAGGSMDDLNFLISSIGGYSLKVYCLVFHSSY